jgi:hypothetical protein
MQRAQWTQYSSRRDSFEVFPDLTSNNNKFVNSLIRVDAKTEHSTLTTDSAWLNGAPVMIGLEPGHLDLRSFRNYIKARLPCSWRSINST